MRSIVFLLTLYSTVLFAEAKKLEPVKTPEPQKLEVKKQESAKGLEMPSEEVNKPAPSANATQKTEPQISSATKGPKATVLKWDKKRDRIAITDDPSRQWARKDSVCIYRLGRAIACGRVIAVGIQGAVVQLLNHAAAVKPGDEAHYFEPEKKIPQITDDEVSSESLMESNPLKYGFSLGAMLGLDLIYPVMNFYIAVSPNVSIGIQPAYLKKTGELVTNTLSGYGGALTVNYYGDQYFRGLWLELGSGFYHISTEQTGIAETINAPFVFGLIGWHEDWAHGLNLGAGIGARFLSPLQVTTDPTYHSLHPIAHVEAGFSF